MAHGVPDPAAAHQQAIIALGNAVEHQALMMGFGDTFAVLGVVLVVAAIGFQKYALVMGEYLASQKPQSHLADAGGRWRNISSIGERQNARSSAVYPEARPRPSSPYSEGPRYIRAHIPDGGTHLR